MLNIDVLKFNDKGLIPAIVQDAKTKEVLMMAYMNKESLEDTIETKKTCFFSRSRNTLWKKGETSGNFQNVVSINYDCDADTLLIQVNPEGPSCHTGENSCFFNELLSAECDNFSNDILDKLYNKIMDRKNNPQEGSYTNYLFEEGIDKILKKVGEEAAETIIASKNNDNQELIYEASDLLYHLSVLFVNQGISFDDIYGELGKRDK